MPTPPCDDVLIIGAGHGAGQAVASLRAEGFEGVIKVIGEEPYIPYQRPPLSKKFLAGEIDIDRVYFKPPDFYDQARAEFLLNTQVTSIDRAAHQVTLATGDRLPYGKLVVATGSRVRTLPMPGADLPGVSYLRTIEDVDQIRGRFKDGARMVVVGGGYIGLEVAAVAAKRGLHVTVLEMADMVMARVVDPIVSKFYRRIHEEEGVDIRTGVAVSGFEGDGDIKAVTCGDGSRFEADLVVVGVGILPNVELAQEAGLDCDNGILVDEYCRTNDPDIFAIGDCTNHPSPLYRRRLRLESVQNALEQAKTAAAAICGTLKAYDQVPWFWSDQYDLKLQIAGLSQGYDEAVVRGDPDAGRSFAVFYLKDGVLIAVDAINRAPEFMMSKRLIADRARIPAERLKDETISMKEMAS